MQHQGEIGLTDAQRTSLQSAVQQAQTKFVEAQWKLSAEGEKLGRILQGATVGLLVRIKNGSTPVQQAKLMQLREARD